jgi:hypothetical protein
VLRLELVRETYPRKALVLELAEVLPAARLERRFSACHHSLQQRRLVSKSLYASKGQNCF